jgi:hypothetical protein
MSANTLRIWPVSPVPADLTANPKWNESVQRYDSGARQGSTPYVKPLYTYGVGLQNMPLSKAQSLHAFYNTHRATAFPWLFKDPYRNRVNSTVCVRTGTNPASFYVYTVDSFSVIPESGSILITSALSGALTQGSHYILNQDNGIVVASLRPTSADYWTASCSYFKKVAFSQEYGETSRLWENFSGRVEFEELL